MSSLSLWLASVGRPVMAGVGAAIDACFLLRLEESR